MYKSLAKRVSGLSALAGGRDVYGTTIKSISGSQKVIGKDDTGSGIFSKIIQLLKPGVYFVTYEGPTPHVIGLDLRNERIELFDANVGVFSFAQSEKFAFLEFCDAMWKNVTPPGTEWWDVVGATY